MENNGFWSLCVVTACNPYSQVITDEVNRENQAKLETYLKGNEFAFSKAVGISEDEKWKEESFVIYNLSYQFAEDMSYEWNQKAVLYGEKGCIIELVPCCS